MRAILIVDGQWVNHNGLELTGYIETLRDHALEAVTGMRQFRATRVLAVATADMPDGGCRVFAARGLDVQTRPSGRVLITLSDLVDF